MGDFTLKVSPTIIWDVHYSILDNSICPFSEPIFIDSVTDIFHEDFGVFSFFNWLIAFSLTVFSVTSRLKQEKHFTAENKKITITDDNVRHHGTFMSFAGIYGWCVSDVHICKSFNVSQYQYHTDYIVHPYLFDMLVHHCHHYLWQCEYKSVAWIRSSNALDMVHFPTAKLC